MTVKIISNYKLGQAINLSKVTSASEKVSIAIAGDAACESNAEQVSLDQVSLDQASLEKEKEVSYQQGYNTGFGAAKEELTEQIKQQLELEMLSRQQGDSDKIASLIAAVHQAQLTHHKQHGALAVDMVTQLLAHFFIQPTLQRSNIEHSINQAIEQLDKQTTVTVKISSLDYQLMQQGKISLTSDEQIRFIASDDVKLGGCLIETEQGVFDGRLENHIEKLKQLLLHYKQQAVSHA